MFNNYYIFSCHNNVLRLSHSAYRKFHDIDPLAFSEDKKGRISFVTVADTLPQMKVNMFNTITEQPLVAKYLK